MVQKIIPNIWQSGTAKEAGKFYADAFSAAGFAASSYVASHYPDEGLPEFQRALAGEPLTVELEIDGTRIVLINAGPEFAPNPSISFMLNFDPLRYGDDDADGEVEAREHMVLLWERLSDEGFVMMPLAEYPFSAQYGWVQDRYGVSWQLMLTDPEGSPRPFLIPALMFDGPSQNRAAEAADFYVAAFGHVAGGSEIGMQSPYGQTTGVATADALAFGEFRIGDQWFMASDNGSGIDHGFTCGVSLQVDCVDQEEIDRLWNTLSHMPEAEQCGWLEDKFGVSWQIVPDNMDELMQRPGAYERLLGMKKLAIADF